MPSVTESPIVGKGLENPIVTFLGKEPSQFRKADIINYVMSNDVKIVNFRYPGHDGRLKTMNIPVRNEEYLNNILSYGERCDGSSLFPFIEAGASDLYIVPKYNTAYLCPFADVKTVGLICRYFDRNGSPLELSPEYTLKKAADSFKAATGNKYKFQAMGELEFYVIQKESDLFKVADQKGYHESEPFTKFESFRCEAMCMMTQTGGNLKYGHSEVGCFTKDGKIHEQNEIEFQVDDVESAADQLLMAKWILRTVAFRRGLDVTFAPKITVGRAGSGLHFHTRVMEMDGQRSPMVKDGKLSDVSRRIIAGYMKCAASITAFGNANPTSYLRLVPHQEAPTTVCWGDSNRSVLVRVPLGWKDDINMAAAANPLEMDTTYVIPDKQTVELRSADGSADIYLTLAALVVAARIGLEMDPEEAESIADKNYVSVNIHAKENAHLTKDMASLPASCHESATLLDQSRSIYESKGVFSPKLIDGVIASLRSHEDAQFRSDIKTQPQLIADAVEKFYHCG